MFLIFQRTKGNSLCVFTTLTTTWQLTYFRSLKNYYVLTFGSFSLNTNRCSRSASQLTHTWLIGCEVFPWPYHLVIIEQVKKRQPLPPLPFCNSWLLLSSADGQRVALPSPITRKMYNGVIFPRHNIYIYIYIYIYIRTVQTVWMFLIFFCLYWIFPRY